MSKKLISLLLTIALFTSAVLSSYAAAENVSTHDSALDIIIDKGTRATDAVLEDAKASNSSDEQQESKEWEQYVGDIETFVYGLIINQLEYVFDVFPASIELSDGNQVYGIAYTDYSDCYTNEEESLCCFEAGFIPFNGELAVSQEEIESGLYITNLDFTDEKTSFIWSYESDSFRQHCVVYNQYLQYGVDGNGAIFYETAEYVPGVCDESLGSLYSFDEAKFLFDVDVGSYMRITGSSLFSQIDFDELEKEINRILKTQDINFASVDVVSCAYFAQEAIVSYLLSLQEETFLGYSVPELVEAAKALDPLECYRITANGIVTLKLEEGTKASDLTKWLVGTTCVILTAVAIVGSVIFIECPPLSALAGAVAGAAIDTFMQVVISGKDLDSVDWRKVAIGAAAGALSGFLGPYIYAATGGAGIAYFALDSSIDGLIGGIERAAEAWMDGEDAAGIISSFGMGFALGFVLSAGFKGVSAGVSKLARKISPAIKKLVDKLPAKLTNKVSAIKRGVGNAIKGLKEKADNTIFHSEYITRKIGDRQIKRLISQNSDELMDKSINNLSVDNMVDVNGNKMTKEALKSIAADAEDGAILGYFKHGDDLIQIVKKNSMVSIVFDPSKYQSVALPGGLTADRSLNFENVATLLKEQWLDDPSLIPESIAAAIRSRGKDLEDLMPGDLVSIIQRSDWVIHENMDRISATLVPRAIHQDVKHMGGVGLAKYLKSHMGMEYFDRLVSTAATGSVIAVH